MPTLIRDVAALAEATNGTSPIALVPTMGALHRGHLSLAKAAKQNGAQKIIVSIYVNPLQFAPHEDFATYPRDLAADCQKLDGLADIVFAPDNLYPTPQTIAIALPPLAQELCGQSRPHFFQGVATVVCKLFNCIRPDIAVFGLKDFQQAHLIRLMCAQMNYPIRIITAPIVREADGLAMSSRNAYLSTSQRKQAAAFPRILQTAAAAIESGTATTTACQHAANELQQNGFVVDYLQARDYATLAAPQNNKIIILAAVQISTTRLIDNIACTPPNATD